MCDPVTLGMAALAGGAALFGSNDTPAPPVAAAPAATPTLAARAPDADVKLGDGATAATAAPTPQYDGFTAKRVTGKPLGGLGRGGLGL